MSVPLPADKSVELPPPYNMLLPLPPPTGEPQDYVLTTMALRCWARSSCGGDMSTRSDKWVLIKDLTGPDGTAGPS